MKKIIIAMLAVLGTVAMVSCEQEKSFNDMKIGENALILSMQGAPSTRSMESSTVIEEGVTIDLGKDEDGNLFFLEETIQDLNAAWAPATKGTPAYTENVGVLYEKMGAYVGGTNYEFYSMDNEEGTDTGSMVGGGWRYQLDNFNAWPKDENDEYTDAALDFYFWMPTTSDNGISGTPTFGKTTGTNPELNITFNYESKTTAADQKDLIFAARPISRQDALDNRTNGVPVLFNHALTGVKFAIANYDKTKNITIKSISFNGLYDKGSCTITPAKENTYRDYPTTEYSSGDGRVAWTLNSARGTTPISSGAFGTEAEPGKPVDFTGGSFTNNGKYPASFSAAGNKNNLNDGDASQTFWLIPQTMSDAVTLTIVYTFGSTTEQTWTIDFGEALAGVTWKAGELRTYTIKIDDVNVKIEDTVTINSDQTTTYEDDHHDVHTIYGGTKNGIAITNTGNTDAFIRVAITGQWVDKDDAPVFSFTDYAEPQAPGDVIKEIDSWYDDQFGAGSGKFGVFDGLVGYTKNGKTGTGNAGWVKGNDGYYYYTTKVAPNATTGTAPFTSYTVTLSNVPKIKVAGALQDVHFVMEVSAQAISAKTLTGGDYTWNAAWKNATGYDPSATN